MPLTPNLLSLTNLPFIKDTKYLTDMCTEISFEGNLYQPYPFIVNIQENTLTFPSLFIKQMYYTLTGSQDNPFKEPMAIEYREGLKGELKQYKATFLKDTGEYLVFTLA